MFSYMKKPNLNIIFLPQDKVIPDVPPVPEGYIPDLPPIPDVAVEVADVLNALGEPTLSSLGLINFTPPGLVQAALEYMHVSMGMPWWAAIVAGKFTQRCFFTERNWQRSVFVYIQGIFEVSHSSPILPLV